MKKSATKKQKPSQNTEIKPIYVVALATLFSVFMLLAYYKDHLRYYYAIHFKQKIKHPVKNSKDEEKRIQHIVSQHINHCFGLDLSQYQRNEHIDWQQLSIANKSIDLKFVILRASMGKNGKDEQFKQYWLKAKKNNLIRGAYHYYRPDEDPVQQMNLYLSRMSLESGDLPPILDVEKLPKQISHQEFLTNVKTALNLLEKAYGRKPILYTYAYFYRDYLQSKLRDYPLWLANYNWVDHPGKNQEDYLMWQFSEKAVVNGVDVLVDLNLFRGSYDDLKQACLK